MIFKCTQSLLPVFVVKIIHEQPKESVQHFKFHQESKTQTPAQCYDYPALIGSCSDR